MINKLLRGDIPCKYRLWYINGCEIGISIEPKTFAELKPLISQQYFLIGEYLAKHPHSTFTKPRRDRWGIDNCLIPIHAKHAWPSWKISLTPSTPNTHQAISIMLYAICTMISITDCQGEINEPQLLTLESIGTGNGEGAGIWANIYPSFGKWISKQTPELSKIAYVLLQTHRDLLQSRNWDYSRDSFISQQKNGGIFFKIPGNGVWLDSDPVVKFSRYTSAHTHNCDNYIQQFTFLAGLASLAEEARNDLSKTHIP